MEVLGLLIAAVTIWIVWKNLIKPTHTSINRT